MLYDVDSLLSTSDEKRLRTELAERYAQKNVAIAIEKMDYDLIR